MHAASSPGGRLPQGVGALELAAAIAAEHDRARYEAWAQYEAARRHLDAAEKALERAGKEAPAPLQRVIHEAERCVEKTCKRFTRTLRGHEVA